MDYKKEFISLVDKYIKRDGVENLMLMLEKTDFYTAPASREYHGNEATGLVQHSIAVFEELVKEVKSTNGWKELDDKLMEKIAIVSLFHDLCKANYYGVSTRNTKDEKGRWIQVPYYTIEDKFPFGHGDKSVVMMLTAKMEVTVEEMLTIKHHMGGYSPKEDWFSMSTAYREFPLAVLLHLADMRATYLRNI